MNQSLAKFVATVLLILQVLVASSRGQVLYIPLRDCGTSLAHTHRAHDCLHGTPGSLSLTGDTAHCDAAHQSGRALSDPGEHCCCHLHVPVPSDPQPPRQARATSHDIPLVVARIEPAAAFRLEWADARLALAAQATATPRHEMMALRSTRLRI